MRFTLFILGGLLALGRDRDCIEKPCTLGTNYPYDAVGQVDTRPSTWGTASGDDGKIVFNPPRGYAVRIIRITGNFVARVHSSQPIPENLYSGALFGIVTTGSAASPHASYAASGCLLYIQLDINSSHPAHAEFDWDTSVGGLLEADHTMIVRRAVYLNETGASIHMEPSFVVTFQFEKTP